MDINLGGNTLTNGYFAGIVSGPGGVWFVQSSDYTAVAGNKILADTTSAAFTITLPAFPSIGDQIEIADPQGTWGTNFLKIEGNGNNIDGVAANLVCNLGGAMALLIYVGGASGWRTYGAVLTDSLRLGLITEYLFASGSELVDTSGNGNTLTNINGVTFSGGVATTVGNDHNHGSSGLISAASLDGQAEGTYAFIVNNISAGGGSAGWLYGGATTTAANWQPGNLTCGWTAAGSNLIFNGTEMPGNTISASSLSNTRHYLVLRVKRGGTFDAWIDGVQFGSASRSYLTIIDTGLIIGMLDYQNFDGANSCDYQKFRMWARALTDAEIAILAGGY